MLFLKQNIRPNIPSQISECQCSSCVIGMLLIGDRVRRPFSGAQSDSAWKSIIINYLRFLWDRLKECWLFFQFYLMLQCDRIANELLRENQKRYSLTVFVNLASIGTTPWSVITARFSSSLAMLAIAAHTLASTSRSSLFKRLTINSSPPTKERTISPAS